MSEEIYDPQLTIDVLKKEVAVLLEQRSQRDTKIAALEAEVGELRAILKQSETILRAFRYSMDSNLPFPGMIKLDEAIAAIQLKQT